MNYKIIERMRFDTLKFLFIFTILSLTAGCNDPAIEADITKPGNIVQDRKIDGYTGSDCRDSLKSGTTADTLEFSYLALGDSYTIGSGGVQENERWPVQLVNSLRNEGYRVAQPTIVAQAGWTTSALLSAISRTTLESKYDLVSLLIGVNNQYIGHGITSFQYDMNILLDLCVSLSRKGKSVFVLSIPDYGATPFGAANAASIGKEIDEYNSWIAEECSKRDIPYFDITDISRMAANDPSLLAPDDLHPSGKMYQLWIERILSEVEDMIIKIHCN